MTTSPTITWDPDSIPKGSGDPETDATPQTLLYIARDVWRMFAPDPDELARAGRISRARRADILFWLAPLESLVRAILFLLLPADLLAPGEDGPGRAPPDTQANRPASRATPAAASRPPSFRLWITRAARQDIVFDFSEPGAEAAFAEFLAARAARAEAARSRPPSASDVTAAPLARRMSALLGALNDPLAHADRLAALVRRHRPVMSFATERRKRARAGPQPPGTHALERARRILHRASTPLVGPLLPYWSSG